MREVTEQSGQLQIYDDRFLLFIDHPNYSEFYVTELVKCKGKNYQIIEIIPEDAKMERDMVVGKLLSNLELVELQYGKNEEDELLER